MKFEYYLKNDQTCTIRRVKSYTDTDVIIPSQIDGFKVTGIGLLAFRDCDDITSIVIPDGVTEIHSAAFSGCTSLTSVTIPDSVTYIDDSAFYECDRLEYNQYDNANYLGNESNPYVALIEAKSEYHTTCAINGNTRYIGPRAFQDCKRLTSITIPDSVTSIGKLAFSGCTSLTSITIPDSVTSIGDSAFSGCKSLTSVIIGNGVTSIGNSAFYNCTSLKSITIPDSVTSIGEFAFHGCTSLTSVTIDGGSIGEHAFSGCTSLTDVTFLGNKVTSIGDAPFFRCNRLTSITIPDSVTSIDADAFIGCDSLTTITYDGTMAQWNALSCSRSYQIEKVTIHCIDGTIRKKRTSGGCYVATCVYGSYDCPQVWTLRRFRDNTLAETWYGRAFIRLYYAVSPTLVKWFGHTNWFKKMWKGKLDRMVSRLQAKGVESTPYQDRQY